MFCKLNNVATLNQNATETSIKTKGNAIKIVICFYLRTIFVNHVIQKIIFKYKLHIEVK